MVKIINELGAGGRIGAAFGSGFSDALGQLAQHKMDRIIKDKQAEETSKVIKMFNPQMSDQQANMLARAPEYVQKMAFERGVNIPGQEQQQSSSGSDQQVMTFGLTPKEREAKLAKAEAFRESYKNQASAVEDQRKTIDDVKSILKDLKKDWNKLQPYVWTRKLYGDKPEDLKLDPRLQTLDLKLQHIANEKAMKDIQQGKSKAGQIFFNASQREKPNIYKDYSVIESYINDLDEKIKPLEKESKIFEHILKKNKNMTPLDLIEQFQKAGGIEQMNTQEQQPQEQQAQQQFQTIESLPEGATVIQNGITFKKINGQMVPQG